MTTACQPNARAWVERIFAKHWDAIEEVIGEDYMPLRLGAKVSLHEHGCGHYGCVMPTSIPHVVCKLTSDASEAAFVASYLQLAEAGDKQPDGVVRYDDILSLPETHYRRPVYLILREEAQAVGALDELENAMELYDEYWEIDDLVALQGGLFQVAAPAYYIRQTLARAKDKRALLRRLWTPETEAKLAKVMEFGPVRVADAAVRVRRALLDLRVGITSIRVSGIGQPVADALKYYLDQGIVLADVHEGNIGEPMKGERSWQLPKVIITDPGHMVPLDPKWLSVEVPELYPKGRVA